MTAIQFYLLFFGIENEDLKFSSKKGMKKNRQTAVTISRRFESGIPTPLPIINLKFNSGS